MKVVKSQIVLFIFDNLITYKRCSGKDVMEKFSISNVTLSRYISTIKKYFVVENKNAVISYDRKNKLFVLKEVK